MSHCTKRSWLQEYMRTCIRTLKSDGFLFSILLSTLLPPDPSSTTSATGDISGVFSSMIISPSTHLRWCRTHPGKIQGQGKQGSPDSCAASVSPLPVSPTQVETVGHGTLISPKELTKYLFVRACLSAYCRGVLLLKNLKNGIKIVKIPAKFGGWYPIGRQIKPSCLVSSRKSELVSFRGAISVDNIEICSSRADPSFRAASRLKVGVVRKAPGSWTDVGPV